MKSEGDAVGEISMRRRRKFSMIQFSDNAKMKLS
jgi:hypothetical protein